MAQLIEQPTEIKACGNKTKIIKEYIGLVNSKTDQLSEGSGKNSPTPHDQSGTTVKNAPTGQLSIAKMDSPQGWEEPGQTPEFDEYTIVLEGMLHVKTQNEEFDVSEGQACIAFKGEWLQYSTPNEGGAKYIALCDPAFRPQTVHRDGP